MKAIGFFIQSVEVSDDSSAQPVQTFIRIV